MSAATSVNHNDLNALILVFPGKPSLRCKIMLRDFAKKIQGQNPSWSVWGAFTSYEPVLQSVIDEIAMATDENSRNRIDILPMFIMPGQLTDYDLPKIILEKRKTLKHIEFNLLKPPQLLDELFGAFSEAINLRLQS